MHCINTIFSKSTLEANNIKINNIKELQNLEKQEGKIIKLKVINNNKQYERQAQYIKYEDQIIIIQTSCKALIANPLINKHGFISKKIPSLQAAIH